MKLFHTSLKEIKKINKFGIFGQSLCFSSEIYTMCENATHVYSIEIDEDEVISASQFFYNDDCEKLNFILEDIERIAECDRETAENFLDGTDTYGDPEIDWTMQGFMGDAAKLLGYRAASMRDEQGICYIVPMFDKENELIQQ